MTANEVVATIAMRYPALHFQKLQQVDPWN